MTVECVGKSQYVYTTNWYYTSGDFSATKLERVGHSDGTVDIYLYGTDPNQPTNTVLSGQPNGDNTGIVDGTRTVTVLGNVGQVLSRSVFDIAPGRSDILVSSENYVYTDNLNRSHVVTFLDGTSNTVQYSCCGIESQVDRDGLVTTYTYDGLNDAPARPIMSMDLVCQVLQPAITETPRGICCPLSALGQTEPQLS